MKHGFKNLVGLSLIVLTIAACGGKKGGGDGGAAAAPAPAAPAEETPVDEIPGASDQYTTIKPGTWRGTLNVIDNDSYKAYAKKVLKCKGTCTSANGKVKVRFDVFNSYLPTNRTALTLESRTFCNQGTKNFKFNLKGRTAVPNSDLNGFQLAYFLKGRYSNLNLLDPEDAPPILAAYEGDEALTALPKLQFVAVYKDGDKRNVVGRVYYGGVKIAEGDMSYQRLDYRYFGQFYDDRDNSSDDDDYIYIGRGRNRVRMHHEGGRNWNNGSNWNDNNFNFNAFFSSSNASAFFNMNFN